MPKKMAKDIFTLKKDGASILRKSWLRRPRATSTPPPADQSSIFNLQFRLVRVRFLIKTMKIPSTKNQNNLVLVIWNFLSYVAI
jgi:hypothetical protein